MLKVGIIGIGVMGRNHARVYSELPNVKLVGIADINEKAVKELSKIYNTRAFTYHKDLLRENLDAVSVAVPTSMHKQVAIDVLDAGINLLIEKPIADTVKNAEDIIKKAEEKGLKLMVGHVERFNPIIPVIKKSIKDERVILINITRVGPLPPRIKDVGVMVDLGVHDIDLIRYLTESKFKSIIPLISSNITKKEDTAIVSFEMENGTLAHLTTDWLTPYKVRKIEISTKYKFIKGDFMNQKVIEYSKYKEDGSYIVRNLAVPYGEPLKLELESFIESIRKNKTPAVTGYDGIEALRIALNCIMLSSKR